MINEQFRVTIPFEIRDDLIESNDIKEDIKDVKLLTSNLKLTVVIALEERSMSERGFAGRIIVNICQKAR